MQNEIYNGKIDSSLDGDEKLMTFELNRNEATELDTKILNEEKNIIGYLPWKLLKSDILYEPGEENYVNKHEESIQKTINIIKQINSHTDQDDKIIEFKKYFPKSKVLKDCGLDNSHIMEFLPKF